MFAHWKIKTKELESQLEKHRRVDQELKKRVLKLEFCLQEARSQIKKLQRDGLEVFFRIKRSTQLKKLMTVYCDRQSLEFNSITFLFDGRRHRGEQTSDELEMEDGDEIDAMLHQTVGGGHMGF